MTRRLALGAWKGECTSAIAVFSFNLKFITNHWIRKIRRLRGGLLKRLGHCFLFLFCVTSSGSADTLSVRIATSHPDAFTWSYAVTNMEPANSPNFLMGFEVGIQVQLSSVEAPNGWDYQTDGYNYVYWFSDSTSLPYSDDIAPGASVTGFVLSADGLSGPSESVIYSWDHLADGPGPINYGVVDAPITEPSPEPGSEALVLCGIGLILWRTRAKYAS